MNYLPRGINILPTPARRALSYRYAIRLITLTLLLCAVAAAVGSGMLIPTYLLVRAEVEAALRYQVAAEAAAGLTSNSARAALAATNERVALMGARAERGSVRSFVETLLAVPRPGVRLTSFGFSGPQVSVSGTASSRDTLIAFANELRQSASFSGVSVPVSQLVGEKDIDFTLSFTRTP